MMPTIASASFRAAPPGWQIKPTVILLTSTVTLVTWKCFASPQYYLQQLSDRFVWFSDPQATAAAYSFLGALLLMGVLPAMIVKLVFREKLADYGVRLGDGVRTLRSILICAPGIVLIAYLAANRDRVEAVVGSTSGVGTSHVEATYLSWIDVRGLGLAKPAAHFEAHGLGLSDGTDFGAPGWLRLNFGCTRATLDEALNRFVAACQDA